METITSVQNARVKQLVALQQKSSERRKSGLFVVEGRREIEHCLEAGFEVDTLFFCPEITSPQPSPQGEGALEILLQKVRSTKSTLKGNCSSPSPCGEGRGGVAVSRAVYEKIAYRGGTEGIIATVKSRHLSLSDLNLGKQETTGQDRLLETTGQDRLQKTTGQDRLQETTGQDSQQAPLIIVLESVEKPGNLGAILRSADAAGATAVIVCDPLTDLFNPNLIRSSLGGIFSVPCVACSSEECIAFLKENGIQILTAQLQDSELYYDTDMRRPTAIVMGTESTGLTDQWRRAADAHIRIPMLGRLDSLNVSVSTAILLFEAVRQRQD